MLESRLQHLECEVDRKLMMVEKRLGNQIKLVDERVAGKFSKEKEILNEELNVVHEKVDGLGEAVKTMDSRIGNMDLKIEKMQSVVMNALEKLELNSRDKTASISAAANVNLVDKSVDNKFSVPTPEQTSFRNFNIALTDVILLKFGNDDSQILLKLDLFRNI